jgi:hypothetical protein
MEKQNEASGTCAIDRLEIQLTNFILTVQKYSNRRNCGSKSGRNCGEE